MEKANWSTTTEGCRNTQSTKNNSTSIQRIKWTMKTKWIARNFKENKTHNGKQLDYGGVRWLHHHPERKPTIRIFELNIQA